MIGNNDRFMSGMMSGFMSKMQATFDKMGDVADSMVYTVEPVMPAVQIAASDDFVSAITSGLHGFWHDMTGDWGESISAIKEQFAHVKEKISGTIGNVVNNVKESVSGVFERVKETFGSVKEKIGGTIGNVVNNVKESVGGVFERVKETFGSVKETFVSVKEKISGTIGNVVSNVKDSVGGVFERVKETFGNVKESFGNVKEKIGGSIASLPAVGLAMGMNAMPVQASEATQLHMEPPRLPSSRVENTSSETRTGARFEKFCDYVEINLPQGTAGEQAELLLNELMRRINDAVE